MKLFKISSPAPTSELYNELAEMFGSEKVMVDCQSSMESVLMQDLDDDSIDKIYEEIECIIEILNINS